MTQDKYNEQVSRVADNMASVAKLNGWNVSNIDFFIDLAHVAVQECADVYEQAYIDGANAYGGYEPEDSYNDIKDGKISQGLIPQTA